MKFTSLSRIAIAAAVAFAATGVAKAAPTTIGPVFVIAMENHNWTQPVTYTGLKQIKGDTTDAPFINSLIDPANSKSQYVSYSNNYTSVGASVHPSEPNYLWSEAGTNFGVTNDNQPFGTGGTNQNTTQHLSGLLQASGQSWKSYQEGVDLLTTNSSDAVNHPSAGSLTNNIAGTSVRTAPINNFSGTSTSYTNTYNGSHQYDYAVKHDPQAFFTDTNGGNTTAVTSAASNYAPLEQLSSDLNNNTYAKYNWITPDQFNDMHTALASTFTFSYNGNNYTTSSGLAGDGKKIAQGDNFLSIIVPLIEASDAFQNQGGTIVIWNDETEGGDSSTYTSMEIVISKLAKGNAYHNDSINYTHSSDLKTYQELFGVAGNTATGFLGDAATPGTNDLSDLFVSNALPRANATFVPEPSSLAMIGLGAVALLRRRR